MWTALQRSEAEPKVVESGVLQPGDAVFFNPTHPHQGPRAPFPPTEDGGAGGSGDGGGGVQVRNMIFMSTSHTKGSSNAGGHLRVRSSCTAHRSGVARRLPDHRGGAPRLLPQHLGRGKSFRW